MIVTSESVNKGHPDKTCDIIADTFLDEALKQDENSQMAVECAIKDNFLMIYGEATTKAKLNYAKIAREVLAEIGYKKHFNIIQKLSKQSPDISQAVKKNINANDQGIVYGFATNETKEYMPLSILMAHKLMEFYESFRLTNENYFPDAKSQVSVEYLNEKRTIHTILISVSHSENITHNQIEKDIKQNVIDKILKYFNIRQKDINIIINPSGRFTVWGSFSDSGCVGRKIVVDNYGGECKVGGGCFSSKNATKIDRSGAYYARYIAKNLVANKLCDKCEVSLSFAIGMPKPININIECFNTNKVEMAKIYQITEKNFDTSVSNIINELDLLKPIYKKTACFGHFGREEFSWEKIKKLKI